MFHRFSFVSVALFWMFIYFVTARNFNSFSIYEKKYNTINLNKATQSIQKSLVYIKEVRDSLKHSGCPEIEEIDDLIIKGDSIYSDIFVWTSDDLSKYGSEYDSIAVKNLLRMDGRRVVKKEKIRMPNSEFARFFLPKMRELEAKVKGYARDLRRFERRLERCVRRKNNCIQLVEGKGARSRLKVIKKAFYYYNLTDEEICQKKEEIERFLDQNPNNFGKDRKDAFFMSLQMALTFYLKYAVSRCGEQSKGNTESVNKSHIQWSRLYRTYLTNAQDSIYDPYSIILTDCEKDFIRNESKKWGDIIIDSVYVGLQKYMTGLKATHRRGCTSPCATNYNSEAKVDDKSCRGCTDILAENFCKNANYPSPCTYKICPDSIYKEFKPETIYPKFRKGIDKVVFDITICKTQIYGCMLEECSNYTPTAIYDDGSCTCGCFIPTAVNYVHRYGFNPIVKDTLNKLCHYRGCTDPCAINYDSLAKEDDRSCLCEPYSREDLIREINEITAASLAIVSRSPDEMKNDFRSRFNGALRKIANNFVFDRRTNDLIIGGNIKLSGGGFGENIGLGVYVFPDIYEVVDSLISFLTEEHNSEELIPKLHGYIIGEADGHPIRGLGIYYSYGGYPESSESLPYGIISANQSTSIDYLLSENFELTQGSQMNLNKEDRLTNNIQLAYVRAYITKLNLILSHRQINSNQIKIGIRANSQRGGNYRRISVALTIDSFFSMSTIGQRKMDKRLKQLQDALNVYETLGYFPNEGKPYRNCPCIDSN